MRSSFVLRLGVSLAVISLAVSGGSLLFLYHSTRAMLLEQMGSRLEDIGRASLRLFGEEERAAIKRLKAILKESGDTRKLLMPLLKPGEYAEALPEALAKETMASEDFQKLVSVLRTIKNGTRRRPGWIPKDPQQAVDNSEQPSLAYATIVTTIPESPDRSVLQFLADADYDQPGDVNPLGNLFFNNSEALRHAFGGEISADQDFRLEGNDHLLSAGLPIFDENNRVLAILALDYAAEGEVNYVNRLHTIASAVVVGGVLLSVLIASIFASVLNRPLRVLRAGAERVAKGDFDTQISLKTNDELGLLAGAFNTMVNEVRVYAKGIEALNRAYVRFVPKQFLEQLGGKNIVDVELGDQTQKQMTILFSDIRSFTAISESMSPRDNFDFINAYLGAVGPVVSAHGGFIDKFIGDAIMALFPDEPINAVKAAIEMQRVLEEFNKRQIESGRPPIKIGIGLHHGSLMLGTVGEPERMNGTVISDSVNLASRLEGLTKEFGAGIIISERVEQLVKTRAPLKTRYLGGVQVKGKQQVVKIFEVLEGAEDDSLRRKIVTAKDFTDGVSAFEAKEFDKARSLLRAALRVHPEDVAARLYLRRVRKALGLPPPKEPRKSKIKLVTSEVTSRREPKPGKP